MRSLDECLAQAREIARWPEERLHGRHEAVSAWSPAQHLAHVAETLERMFRAIRLLEKGDDERILPSGSLTVAGRLVLATGRIPRGRAQAPAEMLPVDRPSGPEIEARLTELRREASEIVGRRAALARVPGRIPHFALGALRADQWLRFARIHTAHHLSIVGDLTNQPG